LPFWDEDGAFPVRSSADRKERIFGRLETSSWNWWIEPEHWGFIVSYP
jgi:hypothetical protein